MKHAADYLPGTLCNPASGQPAGATVTRQQAKRGAVLLLPLDHVQPQAITLAPELPRGTPLDLDQPPPRACQTDAGECQHQCLYVAHRCHQLCAGCAAEPRRAPARSASEHGRAAGRRCACPDGNHGENLPTAFEGRYRCVDLDCEWTGTWGEAELDLSIHSTRICPVCCSAIEVDDE